MNFSKVFLSICAIIMVTYFSFISYEQEKNERELRKSGEIVYAKILELSCGKRGFIQFLHQGKEIGKRIYLSNEECNELKTKTEIGLKIDQNENIVFANDSYNDWSEAESFSIILLGAFFNFCIIYYGIMPEIKNRKNKK